MNFKMLLIAISLMVVAVCVPLSETDATAYFTITDGTGESFAYSGAAERIVVNGSAVTLTIADAGAVSKIVAVDKYSTYEYTKYDALKDLKAADLGSFYGTTNHDYIVTSLVKMVDDGKLSLDDSIILSSYTSNLELREKLNEKGFTKVLVWNTIDEYDDVVKMVEDVSLIASGSVPESVADMKSNVALVEKTAAEYTGTERPKALYVWYYSKALQIGNTGIMKSMLDVCQANNIGYDASNTSARYGDVSTITKLVGENKDAVIFVSNSYFSAGKTLDDFYNDVLGGDRSIKVVQMGLHWNNWCPESSEGLLEIAKELYGSVPEVKFTITDGTGASFDYYGAAERIVVNGSAVTLTIADAGAVSKVVAVDKYSTYEYTKYEELKSLDAVDLGSFYGTTNHDYIVTSLVKMVDDGKLSLDDSIILSSYTSNLELREKLNASGFTKVLVWNTINEYDDVVKMVEDVSLIASGEIPESVSKMKANVESVKKTAADFTGTERPKALYVWYYSKALQIGNTGIMKSMLDVCQANNIGYDASNTSARYGDVSTITKLVGENKDAVVFVSNSYFSAGYTLDDFYNDVLGGDRSIKVVQMGLQWNNWCPESSDGLVQIANELYSEPEPKPEPQPDKSDDDILIYAAAISAAIVAIALVAYLFSRNKK